MKNTSSTMKKRGSTVSLVTYATTSTTMSSSSSTSSISPRSLEEMQGVGGGMDETHSSSSSPLLYDEEEENYYHNDDDFDHHHHNLMDEEVGRRRHVSLTSSIVGDSSSSSSSSLLLESGGRPSHNTSDRLDTTPRATTTVSLLPALVSRSNEGQATHQRRRTVLSPLSSPPPMALPPPSLAQKSSAASLVTTALDDKLQSQSTRSLQQKQQSFCVPKRKDSEQQSSSFHYANLDAQRSLSSCTDLTKDTPHAVLTAVTTSAFGSSNSNNSGAAVATTTTTAAAAVVQTKAFQLVVGTMGIYGAYLYYGLVQEDLFRYHNAVTGQGFTHVWALQVLESAVTIAIGYAGRKICGGRDNLPLAPFFKSGASQLAAKALMSMSLSAGLSFPVVTLAKSAKIVPVMLGQLFMGGSTYSMRDYTFAFLIVMGTALLSAGGKTSDADHVGGQLDPKNSLSGLVLIFLSLTADGFTGGLQKKLKRVTASMAPTTYDFLYYSHLAQWLVALVICIVTGELWAAPLYLMNNPYLWWLVLASCFCSAIGQCFIFYVISCFDPLVCTTITTTRKVLTVMLSITFKGHDLTEYGCLGLGLACTALLVEVEGQVTAYRKRKKPKATVALSSSASMAALSTFSGNNNSSSSSNNNISGAVPLLSSTTTSILPMGNNHTTINGECKMTQ